jgi:hypothetical protein
MNGLKILLAAAAWFAFAPLKAAADLAETQSPLYREAVKYNLAAQRRSVFQKAVADLPKESQDAFWKIYDNYEKDRSEIDQTRLRLVDQYVSNAAHLTDEQLSRLVNDSIDNQNKELDLRKTYFTRFRKGVSGTAAARFYEVDDYLTAVVKTGFLSKLPLFRTRLPNSKSNKRFDSAKGEPS